MTQRFSIRVLITVTIGVAVVAAALLVWQLANVLLLGFAGVLVAVLLRACADPIHHYTRLGEGWALALVLLTLVALFALGGWLLLPPLVRQAEQLLSSLPDLVSQLETQLGNVPALQSLLQQPSVDTLANRATEIVTQLSNTLSATIGALSNVLLVIVAGIFFAASPKLYRQDLIRLVPTAARERAQRLIGQLGATLRIWLLGQLLAMTLVGVLTFLGTWLIGLPYPLVLGVSAGLLDFIPFLGPVLAAVPAVLLALSSGGLSTVLWALVVYIVVQQLEGNLFQPLIQERAVSIPPALLVLSLVAFGTLFGLLGLLVATPLLAIIIVLVRELYVKRLEEAPKPVDGR